MKTVAQMLELKPTGIISVRPDAAVLDALKLLAEKDIGAVLVMDGTSLAGIFSERDYARKVALKGKSATETSQTNEECMALMTDKHIRHLPVIDKDRVLGVLSIGDLVKDMISEQQFIISQLEHYIHR